MWGQALKPTFENFSPYLLKISRGQTSNFADPPSIRSAYNFETAQSVVKQMKDVLSIINALQSDAKLGSITQGVLIQLRGKIDKL